MKSKYFLLALLLPLFLLTSCLSTNDIIPGKKSSEIKNIYLEYFNIAEIYYSLEKYDKAIIYYEKSLNNKEIYWNAYYKLGKCYVLTSKYDLALRVFQDIYKKDQENQTIKSSIAYIEAMNGNFDKAIEIYKDLYAKEENNFLHLENLISIYIMKEDFSSANNYLLQLKEKFPSSNKISDLEKTIKEKEEKITEEEDKTQLEVLDKSQTGIEGENPIQDENEKKESEIQSEKNDLETSDSQLENDIDIIE